MPKDDPNQQTVPLYNPDGSLLGFTTPEKAAQLGVTQPAAESPFSLGGQGGSVSGGGSGVTSFGAADAGQFADQFQGVTDSGQTGFDNDMWTLWNPETDRYEQYAQGDDPFAFSPSGDATSWYNNEQGDFVLGFTPDKFGRTPISGTYFDYQELPGDTGVTGSSILPPGTGADGGQPPSPAPTPGGGGGSGGGAGGGYDWMPSGGNEAPPPTGNGGFTQGNPPADTSWNWDYFTERAPGDGAWGGYDTDYQAYERYQPGQESPWGMPDIEGGNKEFYQQQFANLLREEQGYRNRQREAQAARQASLANPSQPVAEGDMWSWAYGGQGLPEIQQGGGPIEQSYALTSGYGFVPGETTNREVLNKLSTLPALDDEASWFNELASEPGADQWLDQTNWAAAGDPNTLVGQLGSDAPIHENTRARMTALFNALYNPVQAGPFAPAGYASPTNKPSSGEGG